MSTPTNQTKLIEDKLIKNEIPELLAKMVQNGQREQALELLIDWGTHKKDNKTVWNEAKNLILK